MAKTMKLIVGKNLKKWRVKRKISQETMGSILKVDQTCICRIEKGRRHVLAEELLKASNHLKVPMRMFFRG